MRFVWFLSLLAVAYASSVCIQQPCAPKNLVADYVFLVDVSNQVDDVSFKAIQALLTSIVNALTIDSQKGSQAAIYTYATRARSYGLLNQLNSKDALLNAINNMKHDNTEDKNLAAAFTLEESEVTFANGLRPNSKKIMVVLTADQWTGVSPFSKVLDKIHKKYDAVLAIGVGEQPLMNNYEGMKKLVGGEEFEENIFYAYHISQLPLAQLWIQSNACPQAHVPTTTPAPTTIPTPAAGVCNLAGLNYDVYLLVDTSTTVSPSDFAALKQVVSQFVSVFPLGDANVNFGLVTVSLNAQLYYTGFHANQNRADLLTIVDQLSQDGSDGQALKLALQAVETVYLKKSYPTPNTLVVYFSGNTKFNLPPYDEAKSLAANYGTHLLSVKMTSAADTSALNDLSGSNNCVYDGSSNRNDAASWLEKMMCSKSFCR